MQPDLKWFLILTLLLMLAGCANPAFEPCLRGGKKYCVTDEWIYSVNWYSCYLRGMSCTQGGCWERARDEFLTALHKREHDERWVRTYGMHRLPEYFPNRELGIAYYYLNDLDQAMESLAISLEHCESARAKYYLNKARKEKLLLTQEDKEPPLLFTDPNLCTISAAPDVLIQGLAQDDTFVANILIQVNDEKPLSLMELSQPGIRFSRKITLESGINDISLKAVDLLGKEAEQRVRILVDQEGPMIYLTRPKADDPASGGICMQGLAADPSGVSHLFLNGKRVTLTQIAAEDDSGVSVYSFSYCPSLEEYQKGILHYQTEDSLKNSTEKTIQFLPEAQLPEEQQAEGEQAPCSDHTAVRLALAPLSVVVDAAGAINPLFSQMKGRRSLSPVQIQVSRIPQETFAEEICLEVEILTRSRIQEVSINGQPVLSRYGLGWGSLFGQMIRKYLNEREEGRFLFQRLVKLNEGKNNLHLKVVDWSGKVWEKSVQIIKKTRQIHQLKERWRIAVPQVICSQGEGNWHQKKRELTYQLIEAFIDQARFQVIELENLPIIIDEKNLSCYLGSPSLGLPSDCKIWIDTFLLSYVQESQDSLTLSASLADLETGEILATEDICEEVDSSELAWQEKEKEHIFQICSILAAKFKEQFPLCEGSVISLTGGRLKTGICQKDGLKKGMKLILYPSVSKEDNVAILGEAKVKEVRKEYSLADLFQGLGYGDKGPEYSHNGKTSVGWRVITR